MDFERLFLENLALVDEVVRFIARRHRLSADEAEELGASSHLKLLENDYEVLRRFEGRSNFRTYLTTVIQRHFLDRRNAAWGKWRPSMQARRLGPLAVELDRLLTRDGMSVGEAIARLTADPRWTAAETELRGIAEMLPRRSRRRMVTADGLLTIPAGGPDERDMAFELDRDAHAERVERALQAALAGLEAEDRLILRLRYCDDFRISEIAQALRLAQKPLYRRLERVMTVLRRELESRAVSQQDVQAIVGHPAAELSPIVDAPLEIDSRGPSVQ